MLLAAKLPAKERNSFLTSLAKDNLTEFSSKAAVFVINTENYSENSFAAGDLITNLNGVELVGEYQTIQNKMRRLSDSHNFSGTVIRNGKRIKVREPEINDEKKTILHAAFFLIQVLFVRSPEFTFPVTQLHGYLEVK
jgi:hypothetical protein